MTRNRTLPLAALLLGACAGAPVPQTYEEWVKTLPESSGFTPYHGTMDMQMSFDLEALAAGMQGVEFDHEGGGDPEDLVMEATVRGWLDYAAVDRAHAEFEMMMDFGGLADEGGPSTLDVAVRIVADGERLWIEPDWRSNWLVDALESGGGGFADMVFRAELSTLERVMESYGEVMRQLAPDMFGEEDYLDLMKASVDLASWPRMMEKWFAVVESFEVDGDAVRVVFTLSEDYAEMMASMGGAPMFDAEDFAGLRYYMTADRATGVPRDFRFTMEGAMGMTAHMTFEPRDPATWPEGHFRYALPSGRKALPIDVYLDLAASMVGQVYPAPEADLEF